MDTAKINKDVSNMHRTFWSTASLIFIGVFTFLQMKLYLLPRFGELFLSTQEVEKIDSTNIGLVWIPIIIYLLVGINLCLSVSIFKKPKSVFENGFIFSIVGGLAGGLVFGFIVGQIIGLTVSLVMGLTAGMITGLIAGLVSEFKQESGAASQQVRLPKL